MKNKKYFYGLLVVLLLLCAGVGFAAVSSTLKITGTASTANDSDLAKNLNVYFSSEKDYAKDANGVAADATIESNTTEATITTSGFSAVGQKAKVVFQIKNDSSEFDVNVTAEIVYGKGKIGDGTQNVDFDQYFTVNKYFVTAANIDAAYNLTSGSDNIDIAHSEFKFIVVEVALSQLPASQITGAEFVINLVASAK